MRVLPSMAAIRVFEAAARHGNYTRAAAELGMTQAAVSSQIRAIEERVGLSLFAKAGRGVALTPIGERIAPLVTDAFDRLDDAFAVARRENDAVLTITTFPSLGSNWLAARIGGFQLACPDIAVRLRIDSDYIDLDRGDADVAIRGSETEPVGLTAHFLMNALFAPFASPALLSCHAAVAVPGDVMRLPRLSPDDVWWRWWLKQAGGVAPGGASMPGIALDSQVLEGNAAIAGQGAAMLNPVFWKVQIDAGQLVQVHPHIGRDRTRFWLACPTYRRQVPKIRAFREWLLGEIAVEAAGNGWGAFER